MRTRMIAVLSLIAMVAAVGLAVPAAVADDTQDVIYMSDGRVLTGQILAEDDDIILFEFVDPTSNIRGKKTIYKSQTLQIDRDVPAGGSDTSKPAEVKPVKPAAGTMPEPESRVYGALQGDPNDEALPSFMIVPMKGQLGTDIHVDIYRKVAEVVREVKPDVLIWQLDTYDDDKPMILANDNPLEFNPEEWELYDLDMYRSMVHVLKDEAPAETRQVMWVQNAFGLSSVLALSWKELFITPEGEIGGIQTIWENAAGWQDPDVRAKMIAAWLGVANGFLIVGGYPIELGKAMMDPQYKLSATWKGREVEWTLDEQGQYIVDPSDKMTANFNAKYAEDFGLADGTAETLDDLALLLGYREYRVVGARGEEMVDEYIEGWRDLYDQTLVWWEEFNTVQAPTRIATLNKQKQWAGRILNALRKSKPVELRWLLTPGADLLTMQLLLDDLDRQIEEEKQRMRNGGGGGGGGGGLGVGGAGGDGVGG